jgi:hypothetical protein
MKYSINIIAKDSVKPLFQLVVTIASQTASKPSRKFPRALTNLFKMSSVVTKSLKKFRIRCKIGSVWYHLFSSIEREEEKEKTINLGQMTINSSNILAEEEFPRIDYET